MRISESPLETDLSSKGYTFTWKITSHTLDAAEIPRPTHLGCSLENPYKYWDKLPTISTGAGFLPSTVSPNWLIYGIINVVILRGPPNPPPRPSCQSSCGPFQHRRRGRNTHAWQEFHVCFRPVFSHEGFRREGRFNVKMMSLWIEGFRKKMPKTSLTTVGKDTISWKMIHLIWNFSSALFFDGRKGVSMFNVQMVVLSHWNLEGILCPNPMFVRRKKILTNKKKDKHMPGRTASSFAQALGFLTPFQHIRNGTSQIHHFIASSTLVRPLNAHTWDVFALGEAQQMGKLHLGEGSK